MGLRIPKSRFDLKILKTETVLEVGGGHNPHPRAQVIVDKFADSNYHRSGDIKVLRGQEFMVADGENLPFADKQFDYVICNHVLEHVGNPQKFLEEQFRVAKRGYLEVPSLVGEFLYPKESHSWIMLWIDEKLLIVQKSYVNWVSGFDLGHLFQNYFPKNSLGYKVMQHNFPDVETVRIEWSGNFNFVVNPTDPKLLRYFQRYWDPEMVNTLFPPKSLKSEVIDSTVAVFDILKRKTQRLFDKNHE